MQSRSLFGIAMLELYANVVRADYVRCLQREMLNDSWEPASARQATSHHVRITFH